MVPVGELRTGAQVPLQKQSWKLNSSLKEVAKMSKYNEECCPICGEESRGKTQHYGAVEYQCSKHFWYVGDLMPYAIRGAISLCLVNLAKIMQPGRRENP